MSVLLQTPLPNASHQGKVRDLYDLGDRLLIVATDRISAFDVVLPNGVPGKGAVLTQLAAFWFERTDAVGVEKSLRGKVLSVDPQVLPGGRFRLHAEIVNRTLENDSSQWQLQPGAEVKMKVYAGAATAHNPSRSFNR